MQENEDNECITQYREKIGAPPSNKKEGNEDSNEEKDKRDSDDINALKTLVPYEWP